MTTAAWLGNEAISWVEIASQVRRDVASALVVYVGGAAKRGKALRRALWSGHSRAVTQLEGLFSIPNAQNTRGYPEATAVSSQF